MIKVVVAISAFCQLTPSAPVDQVKCARMHCSIYTSSVKTQDDAMEQCPSNPKGESNGTENPVQAPQVPSKD